MALLQQVQPGHKQAPGMLVPVLNATSHVSLPEYGATHANKVTVPAAGLYSQRPSARKVHDEPQACLLPTAVLWQGCKLHTA